MARARNEEVIDSTVKQVPNLISGADEIEQKIKQVKCQ